MSDKRRYILPLALLSSILYLGVFPRPLGRELIVAPVWTLSLDTASLSKSDKKDAVAFRLAETFGYVTPSGQITHRGTVDYNIALDDSHYVNYSSVPRNLIVHDTQGKFVGNLGGNGYPFFRGSRLFVISEDSFAISEYSPSGDQLWERRFGNLITAVDAGKETTAVGLLSGMVVLVGRKGEDVFQTLPTGNKYSVTLQTCLSQDDRFFGIVTGIAPQNFLIYERLQKNYRLLASHELPGDYRRSVKGRFIEDSSVFLVEQPGRMDLFYTDTDTGTSVPVGGALVSLSEKSLLGVLSSVTDTGGDLLVTGFLPSGVRVVEFSFEKSSKFFFFKQTGEFLLLGMGNRLFRIDMRVG